jgi:hypothetical protein
MLGATVGILVGRQIVVGIDVDGVAVVGTIVGNKVGGITIMVGLELG